jgi:putative ABC transport system permease protein
MEALTPSYIGYVLFILIAVGSAATALFAFENKLAKSYVIAILRMLVQLLVVGLYIQFLFQWDNVFINIGWFLIICFVSAITVRGRTEISGTASLFLILAGLLLSGLVAASGFLMLGFNIPLFGQARYLVPVAGMILGNSLRSNIIAINSFKNSVKENRKQYMQNLFLGATLQEVLRPHQKRAVQDAINPTIASIATIGLIHLPGMMTGQILGGTAPVLAIQYQFAIMVAISIAIIVGIVVNLRLLSLRLFSIEGRPLFLEPERGDGG